MIALVLVILAIVFLVLTFVSVLTLKIGLILAIGCFIAAFLLGLGSPYVRRGRV